MGKHERESGCLGLFAANVKHVHMRGFGELFAFLGDSMSIFQIVEGKRDLQERFLIILMLKCDKGGRCEKANQSMTRGL